MIDFDKERRAYEMLKWVPYSFPADFCWERAALGEYSKAQKERSDKALEEFEKENPYQSSPELSAFRELEKLGVYTQSDHYSPLKAANEFYTKRLEQYKRNRVGNPSRRSVTPKPNRWIRKESRLSRTRHEPTD